MLDVCNLDINLGGYFILFSIFIMVDVGNFLENIIDLMVMMIRVCRIDGRIFFYVVRISIIYLFSNASRGINAEAKVSK